MSGQTERLLEEVLLLPDEDRSTIAVRLLDSLGESQETVEQAWRQEVKRRLVELESDQVRLVPWAEARGRIFADIP